MFGRVLNRDDHSKNISAMLLIVDSEREQKVGIGRNWPYRPLGEGECHVRDSLLTALELSPNRGQHVDVQVSFATISKILSGQTQAISEGIVDPDLDPVDNTTTNESLREFITLILEAQGVNMTQPVYVNITQIARRMGIPIPPAIQRLIDAMGGIWVTPVEMLDILIPDGTLNDLGIGGEYSVVDSITASYTKYPSALGNVVVLDYKYVTKTLADNFRKNENFNLILSALNAKDRFYTQLLGFQMQHYSLSVVAKYGDRYSAYTKSQNGMDLAMIGLTNSIVDTLGVDYPVTMTLPIALALFGTQFISMFLDQIFTFVVFMLATLGVILVFALLLSNVEEKTYEYGMLRALGLKQSTLIQVILSQSMYFAIPGVIIGMLLSVIVNVGVTYIIGWATNLPHEKTYPFEFTWIAIVVPVALGILIPIIANIVPIQAALGRSLRDSLDVTHQTFNETRVKMVKLEELGLEPWQTGLALICVIAGFSVYYGIPFAFIFQNLPMFFLILNVILMGMLFGLCMIAVVIQPFLERALLFVFLWGPERRLSTLIEKNLAGHRSRSRKTFLMFTLAVAFVIFAGVAFSLQTTNIIAGVESLVGADLLVDSQTSRYRLPEEQLNPYLDKLKEIDHVRDYGYVSVNMKELPFISTIRLSNLAYYPTQRVGVYGVSENFLKFTYDKYFLYTALDTNSPGIEYQYVNGKPDVFRSLYVDAGKAIVEGERKGFTPPKIYDAYRFGDNETTDTFDQGEAYHQYIDVVASEALVPAISAAIYHPMQLRLATKNGKTQLTGGKDFICKSRALVYKVPSFFFSSYEVAAANSPVLVSMNAFEYIARKAAESVKMDYHPTLVHKDKLLVKFGENITNPRQREEIVNGIRALVDSDFTMLNDVSDIKASTSTATTVLLAFFDIVAAIAVLLCFFMLTISFAANVRDNSWEFGVLRSIGLSVNKLIRAYMYEALALVVSAFFCGTVIGLVTAMTLTAQFNLFTQMPYQFDFPYVLFFSLGAMAVIVAILGSYFPARQLRKKEIAYVLRGLE
jgi:ABC-type antimicrobial peptide transport system permease subunit